jgi:hypothetical protein
MCKGLHSGIDPIFETHDSEMSNSCNIMVRKMKGRDLLNGLGGRILK